MANEHSDPSGNTEAFQAFAHRTSEAEATAKRSTTGIIIGVVAVLIIVLTMIWLAAG